MEQIKPKNSSLLKYDNELVDEEQYGANVKRTFYRISNVHQEDQANDLRQKQQLNSTPLMLTHEETYRIARPAIKSFSKLLKQIYEQEKNGCFIGHRYSFRQLLQKGIFLGSDTISSVPIRPKRITYHRARVSKVSKHENKVN